MKSCVVKAHSAGLGSLLNNVITCLDLYDQVHVDWSNCLYGTPEDGNVWEKLFYQIDPKIEGAEVVDHYLDQWLTYKNAGHLYLSGNEWREKCNRLWQRIRVREYISLVAGLWPTDMIGVLVRCNSHAGEQLSGRSQPLDEYARAIDKETPGYAVYVACGDNETLKWFEERFDVVFHPETRRADNRDINQMFNGKQTVRDAEIALEEVMILSRLKALVHPISNLSTAALYMNPKLKSVYLQ